MTNLSHSASFHSDEWIAPSNRGIKHLGDSSKSIQFYNDAIEKNPENFRFVDGLARQNFKIQNSDIAEALVERSLQIQEGRFSDKDPFTPVLYSRILNRTGKSAKALDHIGKFVMKYQNKIYVDALRETLDTIGRNAELGNWKGIWGANDTP